MLAFVVLGILAGYTFIEEQAIKRVILRMASSFHEGLAPDLGLFANDAMFRYENLQSSYDVALNVFVRQAAQHHVTGTIYTEVIERVSIGTATVRTIAWFEIDMLSSEASGVVVLRKDGLFSWKVASVSSGWPAFGTLFFDAVPDMQTGNSDR